MNKREFMCIFVLTFFGLSSILLIPNFNNASNLPMHQHGRGGYVIWKEHARSSRMGDLSSDFDPFIPTGGPFRLQGRHIFCTYPKCTMEIEEVVECFSTKADWDELYCCERKSQGRFATYSSLRLPQLICLFFSSNQTNQIS